MVEVESGVGCPASGEVAGAFAGTVSGKVATTVAGSTVHAPARRDRRLGDHLAITVSRGRISAKVELPCVTRGGSTRSILARIMYMTTLPVADARAQLSRLVDEAERTHERFEITRNGHRAAVLLGADDYDALRETIAVLSDTDLLTVHLAGRAEVEGGDVVEAKELARLMRDPRSAEE